jgi:hypothetical protein
MQVKYQLTIAKPPLVKDLDDFQFEGAPTNAALVNDLAAASSPSNATRPFRSAPRWERAPCLS